MALSPPGRGKFEKCAARRNPRAVRDEELAPPEGAVGAVAGSVEGDADHRVVEAVLLHDRGDVRVMVLDRDQAPALRGHLLGKAPGEIAGVHVRGNNLRGPHRTRG